MTESTKEKDQKKPCITNAIDPKTDPHRNVQKFPIKAKALVPPTHLLLHWEDAITLPSISTSANPVPLAKMQRPPVASWACWAVHSDLGGGGEREDEKQIQKYEYKTKYEYQYINRV